MGVPNQISAVEKIIVGHWFTMTTNYNAGVGMFEVDTKK
jgi:hypothetical protein